MFLVLGFFGLVVLLVGGIFLFGYLKQARLEDVEALMAKGRYRDAISLLERLLEEEERNPEMNMLLAECHEKCNGQSNAILQYRRMLKFGRWRGEVTEIAVRKRLADCYRQVSNLTEAKNEYLILTKLDPGNFEHFFEVGQLFLKGKALPNALKYLKQAATLNPRHSGTLAAMGKVFFGLNMYTEARDTLVKAVEMDPGDREIFYYLGQAHRFLGEHQKALQAFEKVERDENFRVRVLLARSLVHIDMGAYPQAMIELERGLSSAPEKSDHWLQMHYLLATIAERMKDVGRAIEEWEIIHAADPKYRDVAAKLKQYDEFRSNDQIKELLIAGRVQFEAIARKIAEALGFRATGARVLNDSMIALTCTESAASPKNARLQATLLCIYREMSPVSENQIRQFHDMMKGENAVKGIYMTVGEFAPSAMEYASNRPIDLMDGSAIVPIIRGVMA